MADIRQFLKWKRMRGYCTRILLTLVKKTVIRFWFYLLSGNQWMHILTTSEPLRSR